MTLPENFAQITILRGDELAALQDGVAAAKRGLALLLGAYEFGVTGGQGGTRTRRHGRPTGELTEEQAAGAPTASPSPAEAEPTPATGGPSRSDSAPPGR